MDRRLFRLEQALRVLIAHDAAISTRQVMVFLEVARATDGVEAALIERHLNCSPEEISRNLNHFRSARGAGQKEFSQLIEVRNPPGDRRERVAFLSAAGHKVAEEMHRVLEGGA